MKKLLIGLFCSAYVLGDWRTCDTAEEKWNNAEQEKRNCLGKKPDAHTKARCESKIKAADDAHTKAIKACA